MSAPAAPRVSVIVLSYDRPGILREALRAVAAQTLPPAEVIVVDNRSPRSGEVAAVVGEFPGVRLIAHPDNRGFTGGMNAGLRAAAGEYVALTEDDVVLAPDYLARVAEAAAARPDVGVVSGVQYNITAGTVRCAGGRFRLGGVYAVTLVDEGMAAPVRADPYPVDFVPGSMVFARADLLRRLGGFRADFFMYGEDVELCARVARLGLRVLVVPAARAGHADPPPTARLPGWVEERKYANMIALYLLHARPGALPAFAWRYGPAAVARALVRDPARAWQVVRAWAGVAARLPRLLADRRRLARGGAGR